MAKQSGLHQIRGKVGEHSYYRQTGVSSGLIRSINQGLSNRVKNDPAYANTRLNNVEFGAAANVAGLLGQMVTPKFRPMILPFSQSRMAQEILKVAREHTENWGQRVVTSEDTAKLCAILTAQSKRRYDEFVSLSFDRDDLASGDIIYDVTAEQATLMVSLGITKLTVTSAVFNLATGQWLPLAQEMSTGYLNRVDGGTPIDSQDVEAGTPMNGSETIDVGEFIPAPGHSGHQIAVFVVMPGREINGVSHILQEYCSFAAMPIPAAE